MPSISQSFPWWGEPVAPMQKLLPAMRLALPSLSGWLFGPSFVVCAATAAVYIGLILL